MLRRTIATLSVLAFPTSGGCSPAPEPRFARYFFDTTDGSNNGVVEISGRDGTACLEITGETFDTASVAGGGVAAVIFSEEDRRPRDGVFCKRDLDTGALARFTAGDGRMLEFEGGSLDGQKVPLTEPPLQ